MKFPDQTKRIAEKKKPTNFQKTYPKGFELHIFKVIQIQVLDVLPISLAHPIAEAACHSQLTSFPVYLDCHADLFIDDPERKCFPVKGCSNI